jgi:hypothetical protein
MLLLRLMRLLRLLLSVTKTSECMPGPSSTAGSQSSADKSMEKITPEKLGTMLKDGVICGDSGNLLEERLLGGRLHHRHVAGRDTFQVMINVSVRALCQSTPVILQVETLSFVMNEITEKKEEKWLSDEYVEKLIGLLQEG